MTVKRRDLTQYAKARATRTAPDLANALLWDVILTCGPRIGGYPVVTFKGHYYLVAHGNPWPTQGQFCRLLAKPGCPTGDLCITSDGIVAAWLDRPMRRGYRRPTIYGVQDDVQPVRTLPIPGKAA